MVSGRTRVTAIYDSQFPQLWSRFEDKRAYFQLAGLDAIERRLASEQVQIIAVAATFIPRRVVQLDVEGNWLKEVHDGVEEVKVDALRC